VIVADTNLISYLLIEGERTESAREVWRKDPDWVVPPLWRSEFLNVLATVTRAGVLSDQQAMTAWRRGRRLFGAKEVEPEGERVLRLAIRRGISAYDAHFVVVAEDLAVKLHSFDRRLVDRCLEIAVLID
jgi:predicted nucleic acid-binding protein